MKTNVTESEKVVIGRLLMENDLTAEVSNELGPKDFQNPTCQNIYQIILDQWRAGEPFDQMSISIIMDEKGKLNDGLEVVDCYDMAIPNEAIDWHVERIKKHAKMRKLQLQIDDAQNKCRDGASEDPEKLARTIRENVSKIEEKDEDDVWGIDRASGAVIESIEKAGSDEVDETSIETGLVDLDDKLMAISHGEMIIVAGRPSMGKTSWCQNFCTHNAINKQNSVLFVSIEEPAVNVMRTFLGQWSNVAPWKLFSASLSDQEKQKIEKTRATHSDYPLKIVDDSLITPEGIYTHIKQQQQEMNGVDIVVVDYLQLMETDNGDTRNERLANLSRSLKRMARDLDVCMVAVSQLNRNVEQREDKRPRLSDLRASGALEQDADRVAMLYRGHYYDPSSVDEGQAEIIINKNRNGPIGTVNVTWDSEMMTFRDQYPEANPLG